MFPITILPSLSLFRLFNISFIYLGTPVLAAYIFTNVISFCWIDLFDHYIMPFFVFFIILFVLTSISSDIITVTIAAFFSFHLCETSFSIVLLSVYVCRYI